jgi:hypothetical protein
MVLETRLRQARQSLWSTWKTIDRLSELADKIQGHFSVRQIISGNSKLATWVAKHSAYDARPYTGIGKLRF